MNCPACGMDNIHTMGCGHIEMERLRSRAEAAESENQRLRGVFDSLLLGRTATRINELEAEVRNFAENFDCDMDAHRLGTHCRACRAKALLGEGKP